MRVTAAREEEGDLRLNQASFWHLTVEADTPTGTIIQNKQSST